MLKTVRATAADLHVLLAKMGKPAQLVLIKIAKNAPQIPVTHALMGMVWTRRQAVALVLKVAMSALKIWTFATNAQMDTLT